MNQDQPSPERKAIMQLIAGIIIDAQMEYYNRIKKGDDTLGDGTGIIPKATDAIVDMLEAARKDELIQLSRAHWQKSVPEQAILNRIKALSKGADPDV